MCYCTAGGDIPCHSVKLKSMKNKVCAKGELYQEVHVKNGGLYFVTVLVFVFAFHCHSYTLLPNNFTNYICFIHS